MKQNSLCRFVLKPLSWGSSWWALLISTFVHSIFFPLIQLTQRIQEKKTYLDISYIELITFDKKKIPTPIPAITKKREKKHSLSINAYTYGQRKNTSTQPLEQLSSLIREAIVSHQESLASSSINTYIYLTISWSKKKSKLAYSFSVNDPLHRLQFLETLDISPALLKSIVKNLTTHAHISYQNPLRLKIPLSINIL